MSIYKGSQLISGSIPNSANQSLSNLDSIGQAVIDGQWQFINTVVMDNVSVTGSSNLTYTLSDIPNDGHMYEVILTGTAQTGTANGNFCPLQLRSDFSTGAVTRICSARTRSSSYMQAQGTVIIPLTTSRNIYVSRDTGWVGTVKLWLIGYRRIGTNS